MPPIPQPILDISATGRSVEQLWHHYQVEKALAAQVRASSREERLVLFPKLYDELFTQVPDHPRLHRRDTEAESRRSVDARLKILRGCLTKDTVFMEVAPGDCRLAYAVAGQVARVYAADISDQRAGDKEPANFTLKVFDGFNLDLEAGSVDVAFSYQFLEHLHPDDVGPHFEMVSRALKPGGLYVLDTPHAFSGPHDISRYFVREAEGFHMHEWTYREMAALGRRHGFDKTSIYRFGRRWDTPLTLVATFAVEGMLGMLPPALRWRLSQRAFPSVTVCLRRGR